MDEIPPPSSQWILPPDDVLLEILSRLPVISLLRFRRVSRSWRALISDRLSHKRLPPAMAGIFDGSSSFKPIQLLSLGPRSYVDPASIDAALSFLPSPHLDRLHILSCSGGLLLLSDAASSLLVCNPATRKWAQLPPPPDYFRDLALAFDPRRGPHFKIVSFPFAGDHASIYGPDEVHVFSSDAGSWKKVGGIRGLEDVCLLNTRILFLNGMIHVLDVYSTKTYTLDLEEKECRLIGWPEAMRPRSGLCSHCLGVSRGQLHLAFVLSGKMHVWVVENDGSKCYVPKHRVGLETRLNMMGTQVRHGALGYGDVDIVAFHSDLDIVFLRIRGKLYSYSLLSAELVDLNCCIDGERPFFAYSPCFLEDVDL